VASNQKPQPVDVTEALEHLGRLPLRDHSMESLLQAVADLITTVMPGNTEASVTLLVKDSPTTVVSTGQLALDLDETQYERGQGPCLHAARSGESVEITDTRAETRWPAYVQRAAEHGNLSSLSVPLAIYEDQQVSGALNIYARQPEAFHQDSRSAATRLASYAAVALGNMHAYQSARDTADNLQAALEARAVIDQAKDILMQRHKLTADQAFQVLARASMKVHTKVCKVADHLVHTGEFPHRRTITPVNPTVPRNP
jgi:GAF domain-containing protein